MPLLASFLHPVLSSTPSASFKSIAPRQEERNEDETFEKHDQVWKYRAYLAWGSLKRARMVFKDQQKSDKSSTSTTEEARNNKIKLQQDKFSKWLLMLDLTVMYLNWDKLLWSWRVPSLSILVLKSPCKNTSKKTTHHFSLPHEIFQLFKIKPRLCKQCRHSSMKHANKFCAW